MGWIVRVWGVVGKKKEPVETLGGPGGGHHVDVVPCHLARQQRVIPEGFCHRHEEALVE